MSSPLLFFVPPLFPTWIRWWSPPTDYFGDSSGTSSEAGRKHSASHGFRFGAVDKHPQAAPGTWSAFLSLTERALPKAA